MTTIIKQNTNNSGEFLIIELIEAGIPITTKKIYIKNVPISCVPDIFEKYLEKIVENKTLIVVNNKYLFPKNKARSPLKLPKIHLDNLKEIVTIIAVIAKEIAKSFKPSKDFVFSEFKSISILS